MTLQVEALDSADIDAFVALIRESLASQQLELTIYACKGIGSFIATELQIPKSLSNKHYFALKDGRELVAAIVLRTLDAGLSLDYIATKATNRSRGLGRKLWQEASERIHHTAEFIQLDVFNSNEVALNWYRRLGFTESARSFLWSCQLLQSKHKPAKLINYPQTETVQEKFGFSQLSLVVDNQEFTVGRMGDTWYRTNKPEALNNPAVLACLTELDPRRRILAVVPHDFQFSPEFFSDCALVDELLTMRAKFDDWVQS